MDRRGPDPVQCASFSDQPPTSSARVRCSWPTSCPGRCPQFDAGATRDTLVFPALEWVREASLNDFQSWSVRSTRSRNAIRSSARLRLPAARRRGVVAKVPKWSCLEAPVAGTRKRRVRGEDEDVVSDGVVERVDRANPLDRHERGWVAIRFTVGVDPGSRGWWRGFFPNRGRDTSHSGSYSGWSNCCWQFRTCFENAGWERSSMSATSPPVRLRGCSKKPAKYAVLRISR